MEDFGNWDRAVAFLIIYETMKKLIFALVIVSAVIFSNSFTKAAPTPWGIALNLETKECAGFWAGDEFVDYKLPEGWEAYFSKYDPETRTTTFETDIGECDFKMKGDEEKCCQQLGYVYVSGNIGKGNKTILRDREAFEKELERHRKYGKYSYLLLVVPLVVTAIILVGIILLIVWLVRKKKNGPKR